MPIDTITRSSVLKALEECDRLGEGAFLARYGFGEARSYVLVHEDRTYPSKAIFGVAHLYEHGRALLPSEFSGGRDHAAGWLERLGFTVKSVRNPDWARDELILACALTAANGWKGIDAGDSRVQELSQLLQLLPLHDKAARTDTFRNPNGVARKTYDLATHHPDYKGKPTNGGALDLEVLHAFLDSPHEMAAAAELIRQGVATGDLRGPLVDEYDGDGFEAPEGRLLLRRHVVRERNQGLRKRKISSVLSSGGRLTCEVCGFDYEAAYGERGTGYIECHHVVPLHEAGEGKTKLSDLALLCSNCHRMIHRRAPWPTPEQLRALMPHPTS